MTPRLYNALGVLCFALLLLTAAFLIGKRVGEGDAVNRELDAYGQGVVSGSMRCPVPVGEI